MRIETYREKNSAFIIILLISMISFVLCFENEYYSVYIPFAKFAKYICISSAVLFSLMIKKVKLFDVFFVLFIASIILSTAINKNGIWRSIVSVGDVLFVISLLTLLYEKSPRIVLDVFNAWKWMLLAIVILDILSFIKYPNGIYINRFHEINWFLGYKTMRMTYILPMCFLFSFTSIISKCRIDFITIIVYIICLADLIHCRATASFITLGLCFVGMLFINISMKGDILRLTKHAYRILNYKICIPVICLITFIITSVQWKQMLKIISDLTNKSITLSSRIGIWTIIYKMVLRRPILGYGILSSKQYESIIYYTNAHCMLLTILISGGIVALVFFMGYIMCSFSHMDSNLSIALVTSIHVYAFLILGIVSSVYLFTPYCFLPVFSLRFCRSNDEGLSFILRR